jgi:hypothetical protein
MNWHALILDIARRNFESSGNPYHVWEAINFCDKHNIAFPPWAIAYLAQCSKRMKSNKAARERDLRKVLPWIFGFPKKEKSGPRKLLRPSLGQKRLNFVIEYAVQINKGESPVRARHNACNAVFDRGAADVDDTTLSQWVLKAFNLKKTPENWQQEARNFLLRLGFACGRTDALPEFDNTRKLIDLDKLATELSSANDYTKRLGYHLP